MATRPCPFCAEPIQAEAIRCRFCGEAVAGSPPRAGGLVTADDEHLRLLSIFHYVNAGLTGLGACLPFLPLAIGLMMVLSPESFQECRSGSIPPAFFGWFFVIGASVFILAGWTLALGNFLAGRFIAQRRRRTFCHIVAGVNCIFVPLGTCLGVFTFIVLSRPSVRALFDRV